MSIILIMSLSLTFLYSKQVTVQKDSICWLQTSYARIIANIKVRIIIGLLISYIFSNEAAVLWPSTKDKRWTNLLDASERPSYGA